MRPVSRVVKHDNGLIRLPVGLYPHPGLAGRLSTQFYHHLDPRFVTVDHPARRGLAWNIDAVATQHFVHVLRERTFANFSTAQSKTPSAFANGVSEFNLDDDLLSHGETPHYHRRCIVSLLSSGWDQVVPMLYGRQEIRVLSRGLLASLQQIGYVITFGVL